MLSLGGSSGYPVWRMAERVRLGELLIEAGVVTREQLEQVLEIQKKDGRRLGTLLIDQGLVSETQVTQILSQQLSVPWVSLYHIEFSRQLLNLVPQEIAERFCLVPIFVRRVRGIGETLYVAMDDPSDDRARDAVVEYSGLPVRTMIAPPSDIRAAIRAYYTLPSLEPGGSEPPVLEVQVGDALEVQEALEAAAAEQVGGGEEPHAVSLEAELLESDLPVAPPVPPHPPDPAPSTDPAEPLVPSAASALAHASESAIQPEVPATQRAVQVITEPGRPTPPPEGLPPDSSVPVPSGHFPQPKRGRRPEMITLTLLDGTQVTLPARRSREAPPEQTEPTSARGQALTARDLVEALRAVAHGNDPTDVLGQGVQWEAIVGALLSLLLKKHLVADWEFVEEYERFRKD